MTDAQMVATAGWLNARYVVVFVTSLLTLNWLLGRKRSNLPPGPLALPFVGNAPSMYRRQRGVHLVFADWADRYGSIMRIYLGSRLAIVLNDIESVKEALIKQADCFSDRIDNSGQLDKGSIISSSGEVWKELRRFGLTAMRNLGMGKRSVENKINEEARYLLESFEGEGEKPFDPGHYILNAVSNIICTISFGHRFEYTDPKFVYLIQSVKKICQEASFTRIDSFMSRLIAVFKKAPENDTMERIVNIMRFLKDNVKEHQETFDDNDIRDIIDMYLQEIERQEKVGKVDEDSALCRSTMWRGIFDLFGAGSDTTTGTLLWLILFLTVYPDVQEKVQAEIDDVIGTERPPTYQDHDDMPYTNAVLMEIQRMRHVAPCGVTHKTRYETELLGYTIPANTVVFVNHWKVHRDPRHWTDPEKFDPSRFLSEDGRTNQNSEAFIPFSVGRRACLGETLAKTELFIFAVNLLQRFTFSLPVDKPRPSLDGSYGATFSPSHFEVVAKKR